MPQKIVKFNKYKHKKSKWITHGIIKSIQTRDNMYKKYKITDPNANNYHTLKTNLKTYNTILKKSIRIAQIKYYEAIFCKFKGDIRGTWKKINDILNRTKRKKTFPSSFKDGENIINDKIMIANKFNIFFTNIGPKLAAEIVTPKSHNHRKY